MNVWCERIYLKDACFPSRFERERLHPGENEHRCGCDCEPKPEHNPMLYYPGRAFQNVGVIRVIRGRQCRLLRQQTCPHELIPSTIFQKRFVAFRPPARRSSLVTAASISCTPDT